MSARWTPWLAALSVLCLVVVVGYTPADSRNGQDGFSYDSTGNLVILSHGTELASVNGDTVFAGGVGSLTFTDSNSSILLLDNDTTALDIGSTGATNLMRFDTGNGTETVIIDGTAGQQSFYVDVGTAKFDETLQCVGDMTLDGGAGALTFSDTASSIVLPDNDTTALDIGSTGLLNLLRFDTGDGTETVIVTGTTTQLAFHVDTGTAKMDETLQCVGDVTLDGGAGALTFSDSASSIVVPDGDSSALDIGSTGRTNLLRIDSTDNAEKVIVTGTTATTAFSVPVGESTFTEGVSAPVVATSLMRIRFCGNGPDGATTTYLSPVAEGQVGTDYQFGGAGCDGEDNTTEATADEVWHAGFAFKPVAMSCVGLCTGTSAANDAIAFQLKDDTAAVAGMTCTTAALGGDGVPAQCSVRDASPATVAAGSAIDVSITMTDDDCNDAGDDFECDLFITF